MVRVSATISALSIGGSAIAFLNQLILARYFGAGIDLDALLIATSLPLTITGVLVGTMNFQLVPALAIQSSDSSPAFSGSLFLLLLISSLILSSTGAVVGPWCASFLQTSDDTHVEQVLTSSTRLAWLAICPAILSAYFTAKLQIQGQFLPAASIAPIPAFVTTLSCVFGHALLGITSIPAGMLVGTVAQCALLRWFIKDFNIDIAAGLKAPRCAEWVLSKFPVAALALLVFSVYPSVDAFWAPRLGSSTLSYLGYGQRLTVGIGAIIVAGASTAIFPKLSAHFVEGEHQDFRDTLVASLRGLLLLVAPLATTLIFCSNAVLTLFFQRGAFRAENVDVLARLFPGMLIGMIGMCCVGVQFKALFAKHDLAGAAGLSLLGALLYFGLSGWFSRSWGITGFGTAYAVTWWGIFGLTDLRLHNSRENYKETLVFGSKLLAVTSAAGATAYITRQLLLIKSSGGMHLGFGLALSLSLSAIACWACGLALHVPEISSLTYIARRRFFRG